ncbi:MAG TPA: DUF2171 domain-containing protein [Caulobacteraceae bacterium]|nr:DUF2171 domain-containing protein [Caulobacteraceae bacterium]
MVTASDIVRHMELFDADGVFVGMVTGVTGAEIDLADGHEVGDEHGRIPLAWVHYTWDHKGKLSLTRAEAQRRWAERPTGS